MAERAAHSAIEVVRRPSLSRPRLSDAAVSPSIMRKSRPKQRTFTHAHRQRLERAIHLYLRWCYRQKTAARTSELAVRLGVLPQYISWIGRMIFGKPLRIVLREKQLEEAERLLRHTPLPVEEVAIRSAFGTASTFYRWFIAKHGIAPAAFRGLKK